MTGYYSLCKNWIKDNGHADFYLFIYSFWAKKGNMGEQGVTWADNGYKG